MAEQQGTKRKPEEDNEEAEQPPTKRFKIDSDEDRKICTEAFERSLIPPFRPFIMPAAMVPYLMQRKDDTYDIPAIASRFAAAWDYRTRPPNATAVQRFAFGPSCVDTLSTNHHDLCALGVPQGDGVRKGFLALLVDAGYVVKFEGNQEDYSDDAVFIADASHLVV